MNYSVKWASDNLTNWWGDIDTFETFADALTAASSGVKNTFYAVFGEGEAPLVLVLNKEFFTAQSGIIPCENCHGTGGWYCPYCNDSGIGQGGNYCSCKDPIPCEICEGHAIVHAGHEPEALPDDIDFLF